MFRLPSPSTAISMLALLIALGGASYSATGGNFILGQTNTATTNTGLVGSAPNFALGIQNTSTQAGATALALAVTAGKPPMIINSNIKVSHLNADLLDGLDATAFARSASEGWHFVGDPGKPPFQGTWVNYDPAVIHTNATWPHASYRIDQNGVVHLRGLIKDGVVDTTAFTLQDPYCPYHFHPFIVLSDDGTASPSVVAGRVTVSYNLGSGCTILVDEGVPGQFITLDGISYQTAAGDGLIAGSSPASLAVLNAGRRSIRR